MAPVRATSRAQRLLDRLDEAAPGDVVLVSAPAGWGKTALLVDWLRTDPVHTVWVSLSPIDDSARGFWAILLGALRGCPVVAVGNPLHDLVLADDPSADPDFLAAVADGLHAVHEPLTIVLDNAEELKDPAAVDGLRVLLRDRPPHVRVVLSGRRDPPIPRGRLRAAGRLVEVRAEQLRFTADEAAAMLAATGYVFEPDLVAALVAATGGWAAGLRLAAPALAAAEPTDFVNDLVGTDRAMSDYLVEEVLNAFTPRTRHVLDRVSICEDVSAPLAAALCEGPDAGEVLDALERETGLVYRTGTGRRALRRRAAPARAPARRPAAAAPRGRDGAARARGALVRRAGHARRGRRPRRGVGRGGGARRPRATATACSCSPRASTPGCATWRRGCAGRC